MDYPLQPRVENEHRTTRNTRQRGIFFRAAEFHPSAILNVPLDCIRVIVRDCSFTEIRIDDRITVLEDNYPQAWCQEYVGFTIKGARHFCQQQGFNLSVPIKLRDILNAILEATPARSTITCFKDAGQPSLIGCSCNAGSLAIRKGFYGQGRENTLAPGQSRVWCGLVRAGGRF
jgi:hypothetical protein